MTGTPARDTETLRRASNALTVRLVELRVAVDDELERLLAVTGGRPWEAPAEEVDALLDLTFELDRLDREHAHTLADLARLLVLGTGAEATA
jgi:hypothetical protein